MRLVNKQEFMKLETPFIYSKWEYGMCSGLYECFEIIKDKENNPIDFEYVNYLHAGVIDVNKEIELSGSTDDFNFITEGKDFVFDFECGERDGMYEDRDEFILYDNLDILNLANKLYKNFTDKYNI